MTRDNPVRARINHVSISAENLKASVSFYTDLFGAEPVATPPFAVPTQWLRLGDLQLHIFERPGAAPIYHHFALTVADFELVFWATRSRHMQDARTLGHHLYELPSGQVQLYIRDPGGNLVEINGEAHLLSDPVRAEMMRRPSMQPESKP